jgi:hypothetical protein
MIRAGLDDKNLARAIALPARRHSYGVPTSVGVNESGPAAGRFGRAIERAPVSISADCLDRCRAAGQAHAARQSFLLSHCRALE